LRVLVFLYVAPTILTTLFIIDPYFARLALQGAFMTMLPAFAMALRDITYEDIEPFLDAWENFRETVYYHDLVNIAAYLKDPTLIETIMYIDTIHDIVSPARDYDNMIKTANLAISLRIPEVVGIAYVTVNYIYPVLDVIFYSLM
jgi:hypothetical protein